MYLDEAALIFNISPVITSCFISMVVVNGPIRLLKKRLINHLSTYKLFIDLQVIYQPPFRALAPSASSCSSSYSTLASNLAGYAAIMK